jgi:hypothetical protein
MQTKICQARTDIWAETGKLLNVEAASISTHSAHGKVLVEVAILIAHK